MKQLIIETVCKTYKVSESELQIRTRLRSIVEPRQVAMYLLVRHTNLNTVSTGHIFGLDHSTVVYSMKTVRERCDIDPKFKSKIDLIEFTIKDHNAAAIESDSNSITEAIESIPQLENSKYGLLRQLRELKIVASKLGLNKAVTLLTKYA